MGQLRGHRMTTNLGFTRMAAADGVHDPQDITANQLTENTMIRRIARRIKVALEIARREPERLAQLITDALIIIGLLALVFIAWTTTRSIA